MDNYEKLNGVLVELFNETLEIERKYVEKSEFGDISVNDMHILEAIGTERAKSMSSAAKIVGVTVGTLTIAMNSLVKKGYVMRERSEKDRRVVLVTLSEKGKAAFRYHEKFHLDMVQAMRSGLDETQCEVLVQSMTNLRNHFLKVCPSGRIRS